MTCQKFTVGAQSGVCAGFIEEWNLCSEHTQLSVEQAVKVIVKLERYDQRILANYPRYGSLQ